MLTQEAIEAIEGATVVYGSTRALALASKHIKGKATVLENYDLNVEEDACVLSTGDPMFSGLGKKAPRGSQIIPGISALQIACAREEIDMSDVISVDAHGRDAERAKENLETILCVNRTIFVVAESRFDLKDVCAHLAKKGFDGDVAVLEDLGYPNERIAHGTIASPPVRRSSLFSVLLRNIHKKEER